MKRHRRYRNNKSILIGGLLAVVVIMAVGYAAFASSLKISGTSNISTSWNISITDITTSNKVGSASVSGTPSYDGLTATFNTNLVLPGDSITYNIKVENKGNLNAKLNKIALKKDNNSAILFETSGIKEGDVLKQGTSSTLSVKVTYSNSVTSQPTNLDASLTVTLDFVQSDGSSGSTGGDTSNAAAEMLKAKVVTSGDGLYTDSTEAGRYIYRGASPDNYIQLGDDMYRIIAVESDNTIKVIYNGSIGDRGFDSQGYRDNDAGGTYCAQADGSGCNAWAKSDNFVNGKYSGTVLKDAELNTYLNNDWYNTLNYGNLITSHTWNVGSVNGNETNLQISVNEEKKYTWSGKIGLMGATDYVKASTNSACSSVSSYFSEKTCYENSDIHNWIYKDIGVDWIWTITPTVYDPFGVWCVDGSNNSGSLITSDDGGIAAITNGVAPVFFLKSNITLSGTGTLNNPYMATLS